MAAVLAAPKGIGIDMVYAAPLTTDVSGAKPPTYGTPVWIPEATQMTVTPQNTSSSYFSDNSVSAVFASTNGAQIALSLGGASLESEGLLLGLPVTVSAGGVVYDMASNPAPIGLGYRRMMYGKTSDGRQMYRYVWLYKVTLSRPTEDSTTRGEQTTVQPSQFSGLLMPLEAYKPDKLIYKYVYDNWETGATAALDAAFFQAVTGLPSA